MSKEDGVALQPRCICVKVGYLPMRAGGLVTDRWVCLGCGRDFIPVSDSCGAPTADGPCERLRGHGPFCQALPADFRAALAHVDLTKVFTRPGGGPLKTSESRTEEEKTKLRASFMESASKLGELPTGLLATSGSPVQNTTGQIASTDRKPGLEEESFAVTQAMVLAALVPASSSLATNVTVLADTAISCLLSRGWAPPIAGGVVAGRVIQALEDGPAGVRRAAIQECLEEVRTWNDDLGDIDALELLTNIEDGILGLLEPAPAAPVVTNDACGTHADNGRPGPESADMDFLVSPPPGGFLRPSVEGRQAAEKFVAWIRRMEADGMDPLHDAATEARIAYLLDNHTRRAVDNEREACAVAVGTIADGHKSDVYAAIIRARR